MAEVVDEEEEVFKWMPICDDCDNPVEHYCTTCGDKLCTDCKDHHLSRRRYWDHQVVLYSTGIRAAQKPTSTCTKHPSERYQLYCKSCQSPVCTPCIAQLHSGHDFISIHEALSVEKEKATSTLEILSKTIRPRVKDECEKVEKLEAEALRSKSKTEQEMRSSAKELQDMVDLILEDNLTQLAEMMETTPMPILRRQKKDSEDVYGKVEKAIKEYEDNLRSCDPIDLITFMRGRKSEDAVSMFLPEVMKEISLPKFQAPVSKSREVIQGQFGSLTLPKTEEVTNTPTAQKQMSGNEDGNFKNSTKKETEIIVESERKSLGLSLNDRPEQLKEFTVIDDHITKIGKLRHVKPDKIWISADSRGRNILLGDRNGKVLRTIDVKCAMYSASGMYCTDDGELIYCERNGKAVKKLSKDFLVTTLFTTGYSEPRGICQLQSGEWMVCLVNDRVLRVYDRAGNVIRDIGQGHLLRPYHVTVNKVSDDICVSDNVTKVVVFSISGEKRFTYTGQGSPGSKFNPWDLCCDQLGNILITDCNYHRVHIIDKDGHFLQYLVSGKENIYYPITIDIDERGHAWIGEWQTRKVKAYSYSS